jgi:hypothetical protein
MQKRFSSTPIIVRNLMARQTAQLTILPPALAERLRAQTRLRSTYFFTRIEGNLLTLAEAQAVVLDGRRFPGRVQDVHKVQNYYCAFQASGRMDSAAYQSRRYHLSAEYWHFIGEIMAA